MNDLILSSLSLAEFKTVISEAVKCEVEKINFHKPEHPTEYITRKQTAEILGISLPTLNDWSKKGIIPSYRIASRVRYKKAEVLNSVNKVQTIKYGRS
jgi:excisionase family DNA binding protein